jgi:hypothetical protein
MTLTYEQAIKIARMMLHAATFDGAFLVLHPIVTQRDGREDVLTMIAQALEELSGAGADVLYGHLRFSNGHNQMEVNGLGSERVAELQKEWQTAPVYKDAKGRSYVMYEGVYTQDYCYQTIDVARYVDFEPTGHSRNIFKLQKRLQRISDHAELEALEESGAIDEMTDEEYLRIAHLYH